MFSCEVVLVLAAPPLEFILVWNPDPLQPSKRKGDGGAIFLYLQGISAAKSDRLMWQLQRFALGVSNRWNGLWNGMVEWKMEWNINCT